MKESTILAAARQALALDGRVRVFRNAVGYDTMHRQHYGLGIGSSDLVAIIRVPPCKGRWFCAEAKTEQGRLTTAQRAWLAVMREDGAFTCVFRSTEELIAALERALAGGSE